MSGELTFIGGWWGVGVAEVCGAAVDIKAFKRSATILHAVLVVEAASFLL